MPRSSMSCVQEIAQKLFPVCGSSAQSESEQILQFLLRCSRSDLYLNKNNVLQKLDEFEIKQRIDSIVSRRLRDEPLAYIFGKTFFFSKEIIVSPSVLIPRPDTEILVDIILQQIKDTATFLDACTGSGAIASVLIQQRPQWIGYASDISIQALSIAKVNTGSAIKLLCSDLFSAFGPTAEGLFDFMVCNPPYISQNEMTNLDSSVIKYEPALALLGGDDGLDFYRKLAQESGILLKPFGKIFCEIGFSQGDAVYDLFLKNNWRNIRIYNDLAQRHRVVSAEKSI